MYLCTVSGIVCPQSKWIKPVKTYNTLLVASLELQFAQPRIQKLELLSFTYFNTKNTHEPHLWLHSKHHPESHFQVLALCLNDEWFAPHSP